MKLKLFFSDKDINMEIMRSPKKMLRPSTCTRTKLSPLKTQSPIDYIYLNEVSSSPHQFISSLNCSMKDMKNLTPDKHVYNHGRSFSVDNANENFNSKNLSELPVIAIPLKEYVTNTRYKNRKNRKKSFKDSIKKISNIRNIRCEVLNSLMSACNNIQNSKNVHKIIETEKRHVKSWSKAVDEVTNNLLKIEDCSPEIIPHLYYYTKYSNEEICKDIKILKNKKEQSSINPFELRRFKIDT